MADRTADAGRNRLSDGEMKMRMRQGPAKPVHPWSPGSISPILYGAGSRNEDHEKHDQPTPIAELAGSRRLRWYRDACGDDNIPGRYGEIFRYGIGKLGVQIGGPRANNTKTEIPEGSNQRINTIIKRHSWLISQHGDGEIIFIVEESAIKDALAAIHPYKIAKGPTLSPEQISRGTAALKKYRDTR